MYTLNPVYIQANIMSVYTNNIQVHSHTLTEYIHDSEHGRRCHLNKQAM